MGVVLEDDEGVPRLQEISAWSVLSQVSTLVESEIVVILIELR